ncbi:hypothetical protein CDL12_27901 [Handroanthus impetiginosus]|uniref:CLAVATA3/ESR (CLE)-related protein 25 n=1 Tax=Handroanthus impetiginosus TaxID=429701 RepID=A0A2G9G379_9LAMI|nr:hypothetical protein CDL12_27901 [Handroanthus impetiginosus]
MRSSTYKLLKVFLRLLLLIVVVWFLIVGASENGGRKLIKYGNMGRDKHSIKVVSKFDINYTSKRRIPNGPDPIHNREKQIVNYGA